MASRLPVPVVLVDDEPLIRSALAQMLSAAGPDAR
jgi:DNA-binding NarL/FixJ family response regulator